MPSAVKSAVVGNTLHLTIQTTLPLFFIGKNITLYTIRESVELMLLVVFRTGSEDACQYCYWCKTMNATVRNSQEILDTRTIRVLTPCSCMYLHLQLPQVVAQLVPGEIDLAAPYQWTRRLVRDCYSSVCNAHSRSSRRTFNREGRVWPYLQVTTCLLRSIP